MSTFSGMTIQQLEAAKGAMELALDTPAGGFLRAVLQDRLTAAYGEPSRSPNILSDPKHAEANLRAQGRIEELESILGDPLFGALREIKKEIDLREREKGARE